MPNTKAVGVAYADPEFESVSVTGAVVANAATVTGTMQATTITSMSPTGLVAQNSVAGFYVFSGAITANVTASSAPVGSLGITNNATGRGKLFYSDGSKWQFMAVS